MDFKYKTATQEDIDILVTTRIEVLRAANKLDDQADMTSCGTVKRLLWKSFKRWQSYCNFSLR